MAMLFKSDMPKCKHLSVVYVYADFEQKPKLNQNQITQFLVFTFYSKRMELDRFFVGELDRF